MKNIYLYVGLGNPGKKYENNRHNFGFMVIDAVVKRLNLDKPQKAHNSEIWLHTNSAGDKIILAKPQTFMNNSGMAALEIMRFFKIGEDNLCVVQDDLDLDFGLIRTRIGGGSGGHNGIASIQEQLGHDHFKRIKLGIGRPAENIPADHHVLSSFLESDKQTQQHVIDEAADIVLKLINQEVAFTEGTMH